MNLSSNDLITHIYNLKNTLPIYIFAYGTCWPYSILLINQNIPKYSHILTTHTHTLYHQQTNNKTYPKANFQKKNYPLNLKSQFGRCLTKIPIHLYFVTIHYQLVIINVTISKTRQFFFKTTSYKCRTSQILIFFLFLAQHYFSPLILSTIKKKMLLSTTHI